MVDKAINEFFDDRKAAWLKKNLKASMSEEEIKAKETECEEVFALRNWLPNAASRAGQISISTHPCTFSHPSSRKNKNGYASSIIANSIRQNDGFLRTGNVEVAADALGNAAALDVYKFLTLVMEDGENLLQHLERDSDLAINLLSLGDGDELPDYAALGQGFLAMTSKGGEPVTSSKIKQVYFPLTESANIESTENTYHQLSILTASGMVFELRKRLDTMRFGDEIKEARAKKKAGLAHTGFKEIYDLTTIGYGGTKPQNISVLNNQNGGKAHLFLSLPPVLEKREVQFPNTEFFTQSVRYSQCRKQFQLLHALYSKDDNNMHVRAARDKHYQAVIEHIIENMWLVRSVEAEQFISTSNQLPAAQKTWLCEQSKELRETTDDWLDVICDSITRFLFHGYEKTLKQKAIKLGHAEHMHMEQEVLKNREKLR